MVLFTRVSSAHLELSVLIFVLGAFMERSKHKIKTGISSLRLNLNNEIGDPKKLMLFRIFMRFTGICFVPRRIEYIYL